MSAASEVGARRQAVIMAFALTLFLSAFLLFLVQPMTAKSLLPRLGGAPAVWNTCMVFFQAMLLAGYALAHWGIGRLRIRWQPLIQVGLLCLAVVVAGGGIGLTWYPAAPPRQASPVAWLLGYLMLLIGLPFLVLACMSPLVQKWYAETTKEDPYFLYAASNAGSLIALLSYPLGFEWLLDLGRQQRLWLYGLALLAFLTAWIGVTARKPHAEMFFFDFGRTPSQPQVSRLSWRTRIRWVILAFVPSSLLLGVTTYLSMDIAAVPLLWVVPLVLYLLSFVLAFARRRWFSPRRFGIVLPGMVLILSVLLVCADMQPPLLISVVLHLVTFFAACLYCHGTLADHRPGFAHLTEFYLWLATGGVLGGTFNALVAPVLFTEVSEYPLALIALCALLPGSRMKAMGPLRKIAVAVTPLVIAGVTLALIRTVSQASIKPLQLELGLMFGLPAALVYTLVDHPSFFALGIAAFLFAGRAYDHSRAGIQYAARSFFGIHRVAVDPVHCLHQLVHGNTVHGREWFAEGHTGEPLAYYHRNGPAGNFFRRWRPPPGARIAVVGLGAGSLAAYADPGQSWTFYEIDPVVEAIARDPANFTFLSRCKAKSLNVVLGDGRLRLEEAADHSFDLIVLDAFSSDAVPVHLLTREALGVYRAKLRPSGLLLLHISNRYLNLEPVVARLAADAGLVSRFDHDTASTEAERQAGRDPSEWAIIAESRAHLGALAQSSLWMPPQRSDGPLWTDNYSSIFPLFKRE